MIAKGMKRLGAAFFVLAAAAMLIASLPMLFHTADSVDLSSVGNQTTGSMSFGWSQEEVQSAAQNIVDAPIGTIDTAEAAVVAPHAADPDYRDHMRLGLATLVWVETSPKYSQCFERPGDKTHDPAILLGFLSPNRWGKGVLFLYNSVHPGKSTFLQWEDDKYFPPGFTEIPLCSKQSNKALQFMKALLDMLANMGKLPLYPS